MAKIVEGGRLGIPKEYFLKMAKHDYSDHKLALAREFYQNSIDAGSTIITVNSNSEERTIEVIDNGCGMSLDTLQNVLLALGGSYKENKETATGAFGKAKEVLFFSWETYTLITRNYIVTGSGDEYDIEETGDNTDGTWVTIKIQSEENFSCLVRAFTSVAEKIETDCKIVVDGVEILCKHRKGEFLKDVPNLGKLYINDSGFYPHVIVRVNGIWMHDWYIGDVTKDIDSQLTLELEHSSLECLTSNRDGLKWEFKTTANKLIEKLLIDRITSLRPDKAEIIARVPGENHNEMDEELASSIAWEKATVDRMQAMMRYAVENGMPQDIMMARVGNEPENIETYERESYLKFVGYKADFITKCERHEIEDMRRLLINKRARIIGKIWTETLKQVLLDNKRYTPFTAGFTFEKDIEACTCKNLVSVGILTGGDKGYTLEGEYNNETVFLLNPNVLKDYPLSNRKLLMKKVKQLALHEVAHLYEEYHHEGYTSVREKVEENTWKSDAIYDKIAKIKG